MKITYRTDEMARKLLLAYCLSSPHKSALVKGYSRMFGKAFHSVERIHDELASSGKDEEQLCLALVKNTRAKSRRIAERKRRVLKLLDDCKLPMLKEKDEFFVQLEREMNRVLAKHERRMRLWFRKIFGFDLPKEVTLILGEYYNPRETMASSLTGKPIVLGHLVSSKYYRGIRGGATEAVDVMQHELLHSLTSREGCVKRSNGTSSRFEEALFDYFAPGGILSAKVGIARDFEFEKHYRDANRHRRYASKESQGLLPVIRQYYRVCGKVTIWEFLGTHGFRAQINPRHLKRT